MSEERQPQRKLDVLCVGIVVADHVCRPVPSLPGPGELVLTPGMEVTIGGCAANVAVDLARLGRRSAVAGCVGDDLFGRHVRAALQAAGIDCEPLTVLPDVETACTMVINVQGEDRRFIHALGANAAFTGRSVTEEQIASARVISVGGYGLIESLSPENVTRLFAAARQYGVTTVLDVVLAEPRDYRTWLEPVLPLTDIFVPNHDEAALLLGESDPLKQADRFHRDGAGAVIVTCGQEGAVLVADDCRLRAAVYPVDMVDATGSGDAFLAGFLHARLDGRNLETALQYGSALGACCVQHSGATTGIPSAAQLEELVRNRPLTVRPL